MNLRINKRAQWTGHRAAVYALASLKDSHKILSAAGDGWLVQWDLSDPEKDGQLLARVEENIFSMTYCPQQNWTLLGTMSGGLHWIDLAENNNFKSVIAHKKGVFASKQLGDFLFTLGGDGCLSRWSLINTQRTETLQICHASLRCIDYSAARQELAVGASNGSIYLLDSQSLALKKTISQAHQNSVFSIRYSPNGAYLLSGGRDAYLRVWDIAKDFEEQPSNAAHLFTVNAIAFHPTLALMATASRDKTLKIWSLEDFRLLKVIDVVRNGGHINSVNCLHWSSFENSLLSGSDDRSIIVWDIEL